MPKVFVQMEKGRSESSYDDAVYEFYVALPSGRKLWLSPFNVEHEWTDADAKHSAEEIRTTYASMLDELIAAAKDADK